MNQQISAFEWLTFYLKEQTCMLTDDKQEMGGAKKMYNQQTFAESSESKVAELGLWGKTS